MNGPNYPQNQNYTVLPSSTMATISLIAGILGFTIFPVLASIVAILTGYAARKETRAIPPTASGDWPGDRRDHHGLDSNCSGSDWRLLFYRLFCFGDGDGLQRQ